MNNKYFLHIFVMFVFSNVRNPGSIKLRDTFLNQIIVARVEIPVTMSTSDRG